MKTLTQIYEEMISQEVMGGPERGGTFLTKSENEDDYAPDDARVPYVVGRIRTRKNKVKTKKKVR